MPVRLNRVPLRVVHVGTVLILDGLSDDFANGDPRLTPHPELIAVRLDVIRNHFVETREGRVFLFARLSGVLASLDPRIPDRADETRRGNGFERRVGEEERRHLDGNRIEIGLKLSREGIPRSVERERRRRAVHGTVRIENHAHNNLTSHCLYLFR